MFYDLLQFNLISVSKLQVIVRMLCCLHFNKFCTSEHSIAISENQLKTFLFQEGDCVRVLRRINDDWLYGECNGRRGQFPSSFVSDVSALFPVTKIGS